MSLLAGIAILYFLILGERNKVFCEWNFLNGTFLKTRGGESSYSLLVSTFFSSSFLSSSALASFAFCFSTRLVNSFSAFSLILSTESWFTKPGVNSRFSTSPVSFSSLLSFLRSGVLLLSFLRSGVFYSSRAALF